MDDRWEIEGGIGSYVSVGDSTKKVGHNRTEGWDIERVKTRDNGRPEHRGPAGRVTV